jgi:uncharacterized membrane protein YidH (DUF202 family)
MIVLGIILIVAGGISWFYGSSQNNNMDVQLDSFFSSGKTNTGDTFVIIGIILVVVGVILLVAGLARVLMKENNASKNQSPQNSTLQELKSKGLINDNDINMQIQQPVTVSNLNGQKRFCRYCGKEISPDDAFCSYCGSKQRGDL